MSRWSTIEGTPAPLGVTWLADEQAYNFALYSRYATSVTLQLYATDNLEHPAHVVRLHHLVNKSGPIWHCRVPVAAARDARYYAYVVEGPDDSASHRFDNQKLLLDPYARAVFADPRHTPAEAATAIATCYDVVQSVQQAAERSGYQVERLLEAIRLHRLYR